MYVRTKKDNGTYVHSENAMFHTIQEVSMNKEIERLQDEKSRNEAKLRQIKHEIKALEAEEKGLRRKERNHRIFTRGGMLEAFLLEPLLLTDDQVYALLKSIFHRQDVDRLLKQMIEERKKELAGEETR